MSDEFSHSIDRPTGPSPTSSPFEPTTSAYRSQQPGPGLKDQVRDDLAAARETLKSGADSAIHSAQTAASAQASAAARQVMGIASALEKVGTELEGSEQAGASRNSSVALLQM